MALDCKIEDLIPHRPPFLFVDRLIEATPEYTIGERTFPETEYFFKGHFPDYPVVPGVILVETMAQCGGAGMIAADVCPPDRLFLLGTVDKCKFRRQVRPGDTVRMETRTIRIASKLVRQKGCAYVGDELAAEAEWVCFFFPKESMTNEL